MIALPELDPRWLDWIDAVAPAALGPDDRRGDALAADVARLSDVYTDDRERLWRQEDHLAARLRFFLPRDLPKIEGPLGEAARRGALPRRDVWRVLDLGCGLGTTLFGVAAAAFRAGVGRIEVTGVDTDRRALGVAAELAAFCGRGAHHGVASEVAFEARIGDLREPVPGTFDVVTLGLSLNEVLPDDDALPDAVALIRRLLGQLSDDGLLIVLEPALRATSRRLHRLRDALEAEGVVAFAPCTHHGACPMLARERDWCHEEAPTRLPTRLAAIARAAGLRDERLTWSYLTFRADGSRATPGAWRVVGGPIGSKGRTEWHLCGPTGAARLDALDRHRAPGDALEELGRGDAIDVEGPVDARIRADRVRVTRRP